MESVESMFSSLSETLKVNFMPIAVVLVIVLAVVGWLVYKSMSGSPKEVEEDFEPDNSESSNEGYTDQEVDNTEQPAEDEHTSPE